MIYSQHLLDLHGELLVDRRDGSGRYVLGTRASRRTEIRRGQRLSPATEFKPGERRSPATEFRPGQPARNKLPVGAVTIRTLKGVRRAWVKVAEPNVWRERAKLVWEREHGPIPAGHVIHHRDRDTLNDSPENLQAMSRGEHALEHLGEVMAAGFCSDESRRRSRAARQDRRAA